MWDKIPALIAKPTPSTGMIQVMSKLSNSSPENLLPTVVLESGNIVGRTVNGWKRSGFLESQERFMEEASVAALWFWGVGWMEKLFDRTQKKVSPPRWKNLDTTIGWTVKEPSVALQPLERYAPNTTVAQRILALKGIRLAFSVLSAVVLIALVVPWLNQLKTDWLIKRYYQKPKTQPVPPQPEISPQSKASASRPVSSATPALASVLQQGNATPATQADLHHSIRSQSPSWIQAAYSGYPYYWPSLAPWSPPQGGLHNTKPLPAQQPLRQIRYQGWGQSALNWTGHMVQDTDLGRMFVLDTGIIGGRAYTAARRSTFESAEVVLRDVASYYFYFMAVSHSMQLMNLALKPVVKTNLMLEPMVAEALTQKIQSSLPHLKDASGHVTMAQLNTLFHGLSPVTLKEIQPELLASLRSAPLKHPTRGFLEWLHLEVPSYVGGSNQSNAILKAIEETLPKKSGRISTDQIASLLDTIQKGTKPAFSRLSHSQRRDVAVAVKQAFEHSVGISGHELLSLPGMKHLQYKLSASEWSALKERITTTARQDGMSHLNALVRRALVLAGNASPSTNKLLKHGEDLSLWLEKAQARSLSLEKTIYEEAQELLQHLWRDRHGFTDHHQRRLQKYAPRPMASGLTKAPQYSLKTLLNDLKALKPSLHITEPALYQRIQSLEKGSHLKQSLPKVLHALEREISHPAKNLLFARLKTRILEQMNPTAVSRLFSFETGKHPSMTLQKLEALILGGLERDVPLLKQGLRLTGTLAENGRFYQNPHKFTQLQAYLADYLKQLTTRLSLLKGPLTPNRIQDQIAYVFRFTRNIRYVTNIIGIAFGIAGLGWIIPKVQYALTTYLTGQNTHPGIAAAMGNEPHRKAH